MARLPDLEDDVLACIQCGYCNAVCPTFEEFKWESASPRGKMYFVRNFLYPTIFEKLLGKEEIYKKEFVKSLYICAGCGACNKICPVRIELSHRWEELKEWLYFENYAPLEDHKPIRTRITENRNPYNEPVENRDKWLTRDIKISSDPDILYFVGCTESYRRPEIAKATGKILNEADVKFTILGQKEQCCGSTLIRTGQTDLVNEELIPQNIEMIQKIGVDIVVTACSGCYQSFTNDYPRIYGTLPFEVLHISQYVHQLINEGKLEFKKEVKKRLTYHDPCHLGRHSGVFNEPRKVLEKIPGIEFVEMLKHHMESKCCGAGGGFKIAFNDKATLIAAKRVEEAMETDAELIVTCCPFCKSNLLDGANSIEKGLKTIDLMELLIEAI